ncbi:ubiquitin domain-containing protein UBFD1-like isoform X2 [Tubulanus polymorphus]|uniref:ubiquitin domain-containing protein UBFD1-like isoform X2 n=1 Tax=Tubulanus polymorphus TaxID=672921 RepID=UPI003DA26C41
MFYDCGGTQGSAEAVKDEEGAPSHSGNLILCSKDVDEIDNTPPSDQPSDQELVNFKIVFKKRSFDVSFPLDEKISSLKIKIQELTSLTPAMQKVMFRGLAKDECTLRELNVSKGAKLMVVGSTLNDVLSVTAPDPKELKEEKPHTKSKEPLCQDKIHKKVLEKYGKPEDCMPGMKNRKEPLPPVPLSGMINKSGGKVRLTFKMEVDQLWIGTKERTEKVNMGFIKHVVSEPIEGHEEYHIMGLQLGTTEQSRYWVYWIPAQYVDSIKDAILGKWPSF